MGEERRPLTPEERELTEKNLSRLREELERAKILAEYEELMLNKVLYQNYLTNRRKHEEELRGHKETITENEFSIQATEDLLKNGVPLKAPDTEE